MCKEKTPGELLAEELFYRTKNAGEELDAAELARADAFCEEYKTFLDHAKIEREAVRTTVAMLEKAGYTAFDPDRSYQPGDRIYRRRIPVRKRKRTSDYKTLSGSGSDGSQGMVCKGTAGSLSSQCKRSGL